MVGVRALERVEEGIAVNGRKVHRVVKHKDLRAKLSNRPELRERGSLKCGLAWRKWDKDSAVRHRALLSAERREGTLWGRIRPQETVHRGGPRFLPAWITAVPRPRTSHAPLP